MSVPTAPSAARTARAAPVRPGRLILVPSPLSQPSSPERPWLCEPDRARVAKLTRFYVETPKTARIWLKRLALATPLQELAIRPLPPARSTGSTAPTATSGATATTATKATTVTSATTAGSHGSDWADWLAPMLAGEDVGLMSDAGCPGIADPGAQLIAAAHAADIDVVPLIGPSSILLGLMASGLDGQRFAFHGYLPIDRSERAQAITDLEKRSAGRIETQILIETPYRNAAMAAALVATLAPATRLCVAVDLGGPAQVVRMRKVSDWRRNPPDLDPKLPAVFLFLA